MRHSKPAWRSQREPHFSDDLSGLTSSARFLPWLSDVADRVVVRSASTRKVWVRPVSFAAVPMPLSVCLLVAIVVPVPYAAPGESAQVISLAASTGLPRWKPCK